MVSRGDPAKEVVKKFEYIADDIEAPHVLIVDAREESVLKIVTEDASLLICFDGELAFPWNEAGIAALEEKEAKLKEERRANIKNLKILEATDSCHVILISPVLIG